MINGLKNIRKISFPDESAKNQYGQNHNQDSINCPCFFRATDNAQGEEEGLSAVCVANAPQNDSLCGAPVIIRQPDRVAGAAHSAFAFRCAAKTGRSDDDHANRRLSDVLPVRRGYAV